MHALIPLLGLLATSAPLTLALPTAIPQHGGGLQFANSPSLAELLTPPTELSSLLSPSTPQDATNEAKHEQHDTIGYALASSTYTSQDLAELETIRVLAFLADQTGFDLDLGEMRLIDFGPEKGEPVWMTELEKIKVVAEGRRFFDITDTPTLGLNTAFSESKKYAYPTPSNSTLIHRLATSISPPAMKVDLAAFSSFRTRYYRSSTGKESGEWLRGKVEEYAKTNPAITVTPFPHTWSQSSIIARIPSLNSTSSTPTVIIGAHQDSTNLLPFLPAPGADDDGSGTTSILHAFKALAEEGWTPEGVDVEFHWYSAEEGGLLGSQAIAKSYEAAGTKVKAMIQMDMTAWVKANTIESIGVISDFVDPTLTSFVWSLVETYCSIPPVSTQCGYACSDHASWSKAGYQSAFSIESTFEDSDKNIHGLSDTIDHPEFSFEHMKEFSKLALGFAIELGSKSKSK